MQGGGGSGEAHTITKHGAQLVDSGFVQWCSQISTSAHTLARATERGPTLSFSRRLISCKVPASTRPWP